MTPAVIVTRSCRRKQELNVTCHVCNVTCKKFGRYGRLKTQRYRCGVCRRTFSEPKPSPIGAMRIPIEKAEQVLNCLLEGCSIRSTERLTGINRNTIMSLLLEAGERCSHLLDRELHDLRPNRLQIDEAWHFVFKKEKHVALEDLDEVGDQWIFVALDAQTKLVVAYLIGKRTPANTYWFVRDLYSRMAPLHRPQITTDGWGPYIRAIEDTWGADCDYAQLIKIYHAPTVTREGYSPSRFVEAVSKTVAGTPTPEHVSTSYVERNNLTLRMHIRRLTRLTNGFSKRLRHDKAAIALHLAFYNWCRLHGSLRVTPAMESGLTDHPWGLRELLEAAA